MPDYSEIKIESKAIRRILQQVNAVLAGIRFRRWEKPDRKRNDLPQKATWIAPRFFVGQPSYRFEVSRIRCGESPPCGSRLTWMGRRALDRIPACANHRGPLVKLRVRRSIVCETRAAVFANHLSCLRIPLSRSLRARRKACTESGGRISVVGRLKHGLVYRAGCPFTHRGNGADR